MSEMCILDRTGDSRLSWDKVNVEETLAAEERFNELRKLGYAAFSVNHAGDKGEKIDHFDPTAERLIMVPQMVGG